MKVAVFIDHDIICRHFVMSGALAPLMAAADVRFVFPDNASKRVTLDPAMLPIGAAFDRLPIDAIRQQTWNWVLFVDQLKLRSGRQERAIRNIRRRTLGPKASLLLTLAGLPLFSYFFRRKVDQRLAERPAKALCDYLDREQPDIVFHPSVLAGVFINDLVAECRSRGIPIVLSMNSWDNPSTKRAVVGRPDRLLVWGPQTKDHAIRFMGMASDHIFEFGAAQFDVFRDAPRFSREQFCAANAIDPAKRILLFAGSNAQTDEVATLDALDAAIQSGSVGDMTVIYRPHPWGGGGKDGARLAAASWCHIVVDPTMRTYLEQVAAGDTAMTLPDYRDTHDLLSVVDAVASPLSTILLEGALHGKPVVAYLPADGTTEMTSMLPLMHFEEIFALPDFVVAVTFDELVAALNGLASSVEIMARGARLRQACSRFIAEFDQPWRIRIVDFLRNLVECRSATCMKRKIV